MKWMAFTSILLLIGTTTLVQLNPDFRTVILFMSNVTFFFVGAQISEELGKK